MSRKTTLELLSHLSEEMDALTEENLIDSDRYRELSEEWQDLAMEYVLFEKGKDDEN